MPEPTTHPIDPQPESAFAPDETQAASLPSAPPPPSPSVLPSIPGYEVMEELGRGGMGVVYKARQLSVNRIVALKMILAGAYAGPEEVIRLRKEAEALGRLQHPNIVQIFEVGEVAGRPFCALEYVEGGGLDRKLARTPQPPREAAAMLEVLAGAVHAAHQRRVVHRDLKPQNILVAADGTLKITDFGLAKRLDEEGRTATGAVLGTPGYMAPEQARGRANEIGPAVDVYALGAILYQMLTGRPPFRGESAVDVVMQVLTVDPTPPRQLRLDVPRDLETICLTCMAKEARRRYPTAGALAEDLRRFLDHRPIAVRRVGAVERLALWAQRRPVDAAAVGLLALAAALGAGGGAAVWSWRMAEEARGQAEIALTKAETEKINADAAREQAVAAEDKAEQASSDAEDARGRAEEARGIALAAHRAEKRARLELAHVSYLRQVDLAYRDWFDRRFAHADKLLDDCAADLRQWEWRHVKRLCHPELLAFGGKDDDVRGVAYSPDGKTIAGGVWAGAPKLWDAETGKELLALPMTGSSVTDVAFSRDGKRLAGASDSGVHGWQVQSGGPTDSYKRLDLRFGSEPLLSPDGSRVVGIWEKPRGDAGPERKAKIWDAASGEEIAALQGDFSSGGAFVLSADGALVAGGESDLKLWDAATGRLLRAFEGDCRAESAVFSADGKRVAAGDGHRLRVWDVATGRTIRTLLGHSGDVTCLAFSPDGARLVSASYFDGTVRLWDVEAGREVRPLGGHVAVAALAFRPDGKRVVSAGREGLKVWDATADEAESRGGDAAWCFDGRPGEVRGVAFSADGGRMVSAASDGSVELWDVAARRLVRTCQAPAGENARLSAAAIRPDGTQAAACGEEAIRVWDTADGRLLHTLERGEAMHLESVAYSADGKRLVGAGLDAVQVWDADTEQRIGVLRDEPQEDKPGPPFVDNDPLSSLLPLSTDFVSAAFSPDGKRVAAGAYGVVRVWDVATGRMLRVCKGNAPGAPTRIAWSRDGKRIAGGDGWVVRVWDVDTGREIYSLAGHNSFVEAVAFSPDGKRLASASEDETVRLWDMETGGEVLTLRGHTGAVRAVVFSPDGDCIVSSGGDKTVRLWDARPLGP